MKKTLTVIFALFLILFFAFFFLSSYQAKATMFIVANVLWYLKAQWLAGVYSLILLVCGEKRGATFGLFLVFFLVLVQTLGVTLTPTDWMSNQEKENLPCLGYVDPEFEPYFVGFPKLSYGNGKCTSVIHAGHGENYEGTHRFIHKGKKVSTNEIVSRYPASVKRHYVKSCRGDESTESTWFPLSFGFEQKSIEKVGDKQVLYFAKKGNYVVGNRWIILK